MDAFLDTISSYPTSVYTVILGIMLVFWIFAILGMLDIDLVPGDVDESILEIDADFDGEIPGFIGLLHTLGLTGVPFTLVVSIVALIGFTLCYVVSVYILQPLGSALIQYVAGTAVLIAAFAVAIPVTSKMIKPMKPLFVKHFAPAKKDFLGHVCTVSSSRVSQDFGIGIIETGGSPLQVNIRSTDDREFVKDIQVRIAEYDEENDVYDVISEEEYQQLLERS
ncbi:MAG: hypothetical protein KZQ93_15095 [Candidatus Thiodiazotropha sp. (ex Monitilora ramsayi)]|nr:hypothetical protein [Candidatus Thiodiazotropha sp. (ex Monitilora ramsayi)]